MPGKNSNQASREILSGTYCIILQFSFHYAMPFVIKNSKNGLRIQTRDFLLVFLCVANFAFGQTTNTNPKRVYVPSQHPNVPGVIENIDKGPPSTAEELKRADVWSGRVNDICARLESLGSVLRATQGLQKSTQSREIPPHEQTQALKDKIATWQAAMNGLFVPTETPVLPSEPQFIYETYLLQQPPHEPQVMWSLKPTAIPIYIQQTIALADVFSKFSVNSNALVWENMEKRVSEAKAVQSALFDTLIAEHGILKQALRMNPYFTATPALTPTFINSYSKDFKCLEGTRTGAQNDPNWIFGSINLDDFCKAERIENCSAEEYPGFITFVRRSSVTPDNS